MTTNNPITDRARGAAIGMLDHAFRNVRPNSLREVDPNDVFSAFAKFEADILAGQSVGDYVLVPREPTEEMLAAAAKAGGKLHSHASAPAWFRAGWSAMLAATPASDSPAIPEDYNGNRPNTYVPPLPKGMKLLAVDAVIGAFAYINHAGTWQGMPNPLPTPASHTAPDALRAVAERAFKHGHQEGWTGNQCRRDVQHVDAEKGWSLYVSNGALEKTIAALATPAPSRDEVEQQEAISDDVHAALWEADQAIRAQDRLLEQILAAIDTGRSEPLFIVRDQLRNHLSNKGSDDD